MTRLKFKIILFEARMNPYILNMLSQVKRLGQSFKMGARVDSDAALAARALSAQIGAKALASRAF
jgi:hypothetical protein